MILAGVLIKIGAYGMIRFMVPLFPDAVASFRTIGMVLAVIGIIYGAIMAYAQTDMKRLVAYTSVSHMGFALLGIFAWNTLALQGVVLQLVCHALSTGALFILVGALQDRIHTRDMDKMGGLWWVAPKMGGVGMFFAMASLGLPGLGNFVAEFLILAGTWQVSKWAAVLGAVGLVFATVYSLWLMQRAFQGKETHGYKMPDLGPRELGMFGAMIAALVVLGFYPQPVITTARQAVTAVQALTAGSGLHDRAVTAAIDGGTGASASRARPDQHHRRHRRGRRGDSRTRRQRVAVTAADLVTLLPLLVLTLAPVVVMLAAAFYRSHLLALVLTLLGLAATVGVLFVAAGQAQRQVTPLLSMDDYALLYIGLLAGATAAVALISYRYLQRRGVPPEEYYVLLLTATLGGADDGRQHALRHALPGARAAQRVAVRAHRVPHLPREASWRRR